MTPALLEQLRDDDESLVEKFQWASCVLLKSKALLKCLEPVISSGVRAIGEVKDLKKRVTLFQDEKLALEKAKQVEREELKG